MSHFHNFKSWTFKVPVTTGTFTTRQVLEGRPILEVYHELDGDWQFLCGADADFDDCKLVCLGCMVERDETLLELADLPAGWWAYRASEGGAWTRQQFTDPETQGP